MTDSYFEKQVNKYLITMGYDDCPQQSKIVAHSSWGWGGEGRVSSLKEVVLKFPNNRLYNRSLIGYGESIELMIVNKLIVH